MMKNKGEVGRSKSIRHSVFVSHLLDLNKAKMLFEKNHISKTSASTAVLVGLVAINFVLNIVLLILYLVSFYDTGLVIQVVCSFKIGILIILAQGYHFSPF